MLLWRLDDARRSQEESLSGKGAQICGARWNEPGNPAVYASEHLSLAALERFIHTRRADAGVKLVYYKLELPSSSGIEEIKPGDLPKDWDRDPSPPAAAGLGSSWLLSKRTAALRVPSAVIPVEFNFVLNPLHPDFFRVRVLARELFSFDRRLWK